MSTTNSQLFHLADDTLQLSLSYLSPTTSTTQMPPTPTPTPAPTPAPSSSLSRFLGAGVAQNRVPAVHPPFRSSSSSTRRRGNIFRSVSGDNNTIPAPFPWAINRRAHVRSLAELSLAGIHFIAGEVRCRRCGSVYEMELPLFSKYAEIRDYIATHKGTMHDRAPARWMNPPLFSCRVCHRLGCVRPVISQKKRSINWLFLLLGGTLGCCTLEQLKYFCKHTNNHRTGAKDRVLYLAYLGLCKQLAGAHDEGGLFDR